MKYSRLYKFCQFAFVFGVIALLTGCANDESIKGFFDRQIFGKFGITVFASPTVISMKEVHLDSGALAGRQVVVEGTIVELGEHGTFMVVADDSARMMVVLTQMPTPVWFSEVHLKKQIRVLGTFESGRRGLPLIYARAIRWIPTPPTKVGSKSV